MLRRLRALFGRTNPLVEIGRTGDPVAFARAFAEAELVLLSLPIPESADPAQLSENELLALVEKAAEAVAEESEFVPFTYTDGDERVLPVFTGERQARVFVQSYVSEIGRIMPFGVGSVPGEVLGHRLSRDARVVVNPRSQVSYTLSAEDLDQLQAIGPQEAR